MASPETGERAASITKRQNDRAWPDIKRALRKGEEIASWLRRHPVSRLIALLTSQSDLAEERRT